MQEFFQSLANNIAGYIRDITPSDVIDILIVTFIIYHIVKLLRRSNAFRVVQGVLLLVLIMLLSQVMGLHTISFFLRNTFQVGLLALIIMFQPELRKMLEQIGDRSRLTKLLPKEQRSALDMSLRQVANACRELSWEKTGALIVFTRASVITEIEQTGTSINADVSAELIRNIFFSNSPLHDGAIVISGDKIIAASCMLPLTNQSIAKELGMRHRAALGLSEMSDAICVVVSEETGSISHTADGIMKRHLTPDALLKLLHEDMGELLEKTAVKGWRRFISKRRRKSS